VRCPRCFREMRKEVFHFEHETVVEYRCPNCKYVEKHHYIRYRPKRKTKPYKVVKRWLSAPLSDAIGRQSGLTAT